jgi:transketolase
MKKPDVNELKVLAKDFRRQILQMTHRAGCGHPGGSLSSVEIMISLYGHALNHRPKEPRWEDRDRVIISKGHCTPIVYVTLAHYGYFPMKELETFRQMGSRLQGHVHSDAPGVEFNTGSLGHGLSVAVGCALGARMQKKKFRSFCLLGDGEIQEGSIWEAAMHASHQKLDNLCAIVDYNKVQQNDLVNKIKNLEPLAERWKSFGWEVTEIDGHDFKKVLAALEKFASVKGKPYCIIAHTLKGKGVSFMELNPEFHGKAPNDAELEKALAELQ